ncbi:MAG: methyltransferase domain-containing protein [Deltaproteobacteria bacterium]
MKKMQVDRDAFLRNIKQETKRLTKQMGYLQSKKNADSLADILSLDGEEFIDAAYRYVLSRTPDEYGMSYYRTCLAQGRLDKKDILCRLAYSKEARKAGFKSDEIGISRLVLNLPAIGPLFRYLKCFFNPLSLYKNLKSLEFELYQVKKDKKILEGFLDKLEQELRSVGSRADKLEQELRSVGSRADKLEQELHSVGSRADRVERDLHLRVDEFRQAAFQKASALSDEVARIRRTALDLDRRLNLQALRALRSNEADAYSVQQESLSSLSSVYVDFEDSFRGSREEIEDKLKRYLPLLPKPETRPRCLDLGCGRGEWLELLRWHGYDAIGVDKNPNLSAMAMEYGFEVVFDDVFHFLSVQKGASFHVVTAFHFIEHLSFSSQLLLLDEVYRVLVPGGIAIFETPNPRNILVGSGDFYRDPDHIRPVFPDTLQFLGSARDFRPSKAYFLEQDGLVEADLYRFDKLEDYVKVSRDFVWIGTKPSL